VFAVPDQQPLGLGEPLLERAVFVNGLARAGGGKMKEEDGGRSEEEGEVWVWERVSDCKRQLPKHGDREHVVRLRRW